MMKEQEAIEIIKKMCTGNPTSEQREALDMMCEALEMRCQLGKDIPKVGDTVYWVDALRQISEIKVAGFNIGVIDEDRGFILGGFGVNLFTSYDDAEKARKQ